MRHTISASAALLAAVAADLAAASLDITAQGSVAFGTNVRVLPNGNIVVTDPSGPTANIARRTLPFLEDVLT